MDNKIHLELDEDLAMDIVALMINHGAMVDALYENCEPAKSLTDKVSEIVLGAVVEQSGRTYTSNDLEERARSFTTSGLKL